MTLGRRLLLALLVAVTLLGQCAGSELPHESAPLRRVEAAS